MASGSCCWGNLVALKMLEDGSFEQGDAVQLMKNEVTIGRLQACDVAHTENKLLSGCHCRLIHNSDNGKKYLLDTSKNGTLVNNRKVKNGMTEISDGAIISCVHKKKEPANDVTYIFKDLSPPEINVQERNLDINCTQEYDCDADENVEESSVSEKKRKSNLNTEDGIQSKIPRIDSSCRAKSLEPTSEKIKENDREVEENLTCGICQDIFHECVSVQPCMHSFCAACYSGWMSQSKICPTCRKSVKQVGKNHILNNLVAAFLKKHPECQRAKEELDEMNKKDLIKGQTNYLAQKSIGVKDLLKICVEKLQSKEFVCPSRPDLTANDIVCFSCGLRYFKELTYQYRSHIPEGELPVEVMRRDKCYWGKNCRTQQHNNNHARYEFFLLLT
eukprot:gene15507-6768_t